MLDYLTPDKHITYKTRSTKSGSTIDCEHLLLRISVDAKPFIGKRFTSLIAWANKIKKNIPITILIADTLARYNYVSLENMSMEDAKEHARKVGIKWYSRHSDSILDLRKSRKNVNIVWWQDCLFDPEFIKYKSAYQKLYHTDPEFSFEVNRDVERFVNARRQLQKNLNEKLLYELSTEFILEETAVHKIYSDKLGGCHAYPSDQLHSEAYLCKNNLNIPNYLIFNSYRYIRLKVEKK